MRQFTFPVPGTKKEVPKVILLVLTGGYVSRSVDIMVSYISFDRFAKLNTYGPIDNPSYTPAQFAVCAFGRCLEDVLECI